MNMKTWTEVQNEYYCPSCGLLLEAVEWHYTAESSQPEARITCERVEFSQECDCTPEQVQYYENKGAGEDEN